ncbi:TetR/AcrR family transcriptional regulator [Rhodococcus sp. TAF43]|uniref:TetR/AcrR family transcriptional regulator n=1 Tax=unclassified Rhodococcus (in: high G+C Gram-positive bacteria) TaxID=192944 RepID=UPI000E0BB0E4|nr:TetR/AcrR family transcriptional regulator [Rhodococcus sp. AG1013]RDI35880.1 TetR family transcriptional regulator [Rhodococcus sp. AG1013]
MTMSKGAQRQAELLDAAERVLTTRGNANAALRDFAAEAGVRIGHLQHYFPTRADLIRAVLDRALDRSLARLSAATGQPVGGGDARTVTREDTARMLRVLLSEQDDPACLRLFREIWAIAGGDEQTAAVVRAFYRTYVGHVADLIACARPALPANRRTALAENVVSLLEGSAVVRSEIGVRRTKAGDVEMVRAAVMLIHGDGGRPA